jgi:hypothetical protein
MPSNLTANPPTFGEPAAARRPLSSLCHEIGLAAVAIELDLELSTLDHDVAEAIAQGAAALFDAATGQVRSDLGEAFGPMRTAAVTKCGAGQARQKNRGRCRSGKARLSGVKPLQLPQADQVVRDIPA